MLTSVTDLSYIYKYKDGEREKMTLTTYQLFQHLQTH